MVTREGEGRLFKNRPRKGWTSLVYSVPDNLMSSARTTKPGNWTSGWMKTVFGKRLHE